MEKWFADCRFGLEIRYSPFMFSTLPGTTCPSMWGAQMIMSKICLSILARCDLKRYSRQDRCLSAFDAKVTRQVGQTSVVNIVLS